ncbi:MAG: hypothetical protein E5X56_04750 [Mesorhizobium sp.]|nr:MAG: hypothetical protein E5X56_04750 [Mesorhizobium sp.]
MVLFLRLGAKSLAWTPNLSGTGQEAEGVAAGVAVLPVAAVRGLHLNPGFSMHVAQKWSRFWDNDMHQIKVQPCGARRRGKSGRRTARWLDHDPEKWKPVFGQDHGQLISVSEPRRAAGRGSGRA